MNEPRRWRDKGNDAPPDARALLLLGDRPASLPTDVRLRGAAHLSKLGAASTGMSLAARVVLVSTMGAAGVGSYAVVRHRAPTASAHNARSTLPRASAPVALPAPVAVPALTETPALPETAPVVATPVPVTPSPVTPSRVTVRVVSAPAPRALAPVRAPVASPVVLPVVANVAASPVTVGAPTGGGGVAPAAPEDSLIREMRLVESARAVVRSSPDVALARLREHATEFPRGQLAVEREVLAVEALVRAGRMAEARARGESLLARRPGSGAERRVRVLLGQGP